MIYQSKNPIGYRTLLTWKRMGFAEKRFWNLAETKYGIKRDEKGIVKRDKKDTAENGEKGKTSSPL